jgi:hypothetical protein
MGFLSNSRVRDLVRFFCSIDRTVQNEPRGPARQDSERRAGLKKTRHELTFERAPSCAFSGSSQQFKFEL